MPQAAPTAQLLPVLLRRLPGTLTWFTAAAFALLVTVIVLFAGLGYLNMTAFEMGAAVIVYVWLLLLIRTVSAAAEELPEVTTGPGTRPAGPAGARDEVPPGGAGGRGTMRA